VDALLARLRPPFVAYFVPFIGRDDAEDAAQLALLSILRALPGIDAGRALGYVVAVAQHSLGKARRRRVCAKRRYLPLEFAAAVESPVAADWDTEYHEVARVVQARRDALLEPLRAVNPSTLAARQHVSPATIRSRRRRARTSLRAALASLR
jgi:DNA-directed RNA polymerase specialized sigma24 family protein